MENYHLPTSDKSSGLKLPCAEGRWVHDLELSSIYQCHVIRYFDIGYQASHLSIINIIDSNVI